MPSGVENDIEVVEDRYYGKVSVIDTEDKANWVMNHLDYLCENGSDY